ncbi:hypothetical protein C2869_17500 [Saccharobesus litoralis]|uniref:Response regulatory domain-containing protein n=1 Tax=Saccharobesus litoralis TaxID=2172099 RepID=A0A2S0VV62_9ALTE|nr:response regulator [Saccharobesus litoralis]AWB68107.1 hypothetical protein C2869_17500 [Saccharobesus litoralis]
MLLDVLVVDDDKLIHKIIDKLLAEHFTLHHCFSGDEAIEQLANVQPQLILLDVEMPGRNGYEVCDDIRSQSQYDHVPVVFLSGKTSLREVMLGYEAGADDYIVKPFDANLLLAKLQILTKNLSEFEQLSSQVQQAQDMAMEALRGNSELGQVMLFIEQSYGITQIETLAERFFALTGMLGLKTCLSLTLNGQNYVYSQNGIVKPLEKELLHATKHENRFVDFGCRTIINYPRVSVLIKNMPLDNAEDYGRYKDLFPAVLGAVDAKVAALEEQALIVEHAKQLSDSFSTIRETLVNLAATLNTNSKQSYEHLQGMYAELQQHIPKLGLEEDQELYILDLTQQTIDKVATTTYDSDKTNRELAKVILTMQRLVKEQNKVVEEVQKDTMRVQGVEFVPEQGDDYQMDVELF